MEEAQRLPAAFSVRAEAKNRRTVHAVAKDSSSRRVRSSRGIDLPDRRYLEIFKDEIEVVVVVVVVVVVEDGGRTQNETVEERTDGFRREAGRLSQQQHKAGKKKEEKREKDSHNPRTLMVTIHQQ